LVDCSSDDANEHPELFLTNLSMIELPGKPIDAGGGPVRDSFKIWKPGEWVFKFPHAIHKYIFPKQRIMFNNSLKYRIDREVNARLHDPVIPLKDHLQNNVWNPGGSKSFKLVAITLLQ